MGSIWRALLDSVGGLLALVAVLLGIFLIAIGFFAGLT